MPATRKVFPCGHRGKCQYCHRCEQQQKARRQRQLENEARQKVLAKAPIPLNHLPHNVANKASKILAKLSRGTPYYQLKGKRLHGRNRQIISVPVGWSYRLIGEDMGSEIRWLEVLSHEEYDKRF